jgi:hypothetical protein
VCLCAYIFGLMLFFALLRTARETYQHFISDEVVQLSDFVDFHKDSSLRFAENYERGNLWLEILIRSSTHHIEAIIGSFFFYFCEICAGNHESKMIPGGEGNPLLHGNSPMLVNPVQFVEAPKRTTSEWKPCRSIVWLKRFDVIDGGRAETVNFSVESTLRFGVQRFFKNREFAHFGIGASPVINQGPYSLIQGGTQTLEVVSADQVDRHMGFFGVDAISDLTPFQFLLGSDGMGIRTERADSFSQSVQMTLCPLGLPMSIA